jgi:uncharacterized protein YgiB involved in biofilm formation
MILHGRGLAIALALPFGAAAIILVLLLVLPGMRGRSFRVYPSVDSCQADYGAADCATAYREAAAEHAQTAPRYATLADCEQAHGQGYCMSGDGPAPFLPIMAGFLIAQAAAAETYYQPIYLNRQGLAFSGGVPLDMYQDDCSGGGCQSGAFFSVDFSNSGRRTYVVERVSAVKPLSGSRLSVVSSANSITRGGFGSLGRFFGHIGG